MEADEWHEPPVPDERALHLAGLDEHEIAIMRRALRPQNDTPALPWSEIFKASIREE